MEGDAAIKQGTEVRYLSIGISNVKWMCESAGTDGRAQTIYKSKCQMGVRECGYRQEGADIEWVRERVESAGAVGRAWTTCKHERRMGVWTRGRKLMGICLKCGISRTNTKSCDHL